MKFKRLVVLVTSVAFVAGVQPGAHAGSARRISRPHLRRPGASDHPRPPRWSISGTVLRFDRIDRAQSAQCSCEVSTKAPSSGRR